uniref:Uncharacterized protein n=1 Tax=Rhizophora mucronata TaxID=61149 RepID=A0A2P2KHJ9_RHIMU
MFSPTFYLPESSFLFPAFFPVSKQRRKK